MRREIFSEEHDLFREQVRRFVREELEPHALAWNEAGIVPRSAWKRTTSRTEPPIRTRSSGMLHRVVDCALKST